MLLFDVILVVDLVVVRSLWFDDLWSRGQLWSVDPWGRYNNEPNRVNCDRLIWVIGLVHKLVIMFNNYVDILQVWDQGCSFGSKVTLFSPPAHTWVGGLGDFWTRSFDFLAQLGLSNPIFLSGIEWGWLIPGQGEAWLPISCVMEGEGNPRPVPPWLCGIDRSPTLGGGSCTRVVLLEGGGVF